jgi:soluble epoxide hydrolase/lipid-phosphate phosphatase
MVFVKVLDVNNTTFSSIRFGWRYQIGPWCRQGFRVIVPDMLGYGETDMPHNASAYSMKNICNDISALLDFLEIPKAVRWFYLLD